MHSPSKVDLVLIIGARDVRFIRYTLLSIAQFWKPSEISYVKLVLSPNDIKYVQSILKVLKSISSHNVKFEILNRQKIQKLIPMPSLNSEASYITQRYLKVFAYKFSNADFIWFVDSDYLLTSLMSEDELIYEGKTSWVFSNWVKSSISETAWRSGSEIMLGEEIPHNFMMNPPFICNRQNLEMMSSLVTDEKIQLAREYFSEFVYIGAFSFKYQVQSTRFVYLEVDDPRSYSAWVHQNPTTGALKLHLTGREPEFENLKFIVFWSHIAEIEDLMENKLKSLSVKEHLNKAFIQTRNQIALKEHIRAFKRVNLKEDLLNYYSYSDGWLYRRIVFKVNGGVETSLKFKMPEGVEIKLLKLSDAAVRIESRNGSVSINIPTAIFGKLVGFEFKSKNEEPGTSRKLYGQFN